MIGITHPRGAHLVTQVFPDGLLVRHVDSHRDVQACRAAWERRDYAAWPPLVRWFDERGTPPLEPLGEPPC